MSTVDSAACEAAGRHVITTRHASGECPVEPSHTWTFMGHWDNDRIVVEYYVEGEVQDPREDVGFWEQGLWAASGTGDTVEEAQAAVIKEYEDAERGIIPADQIKVPPLQMDVSGFYEGNPFPEPTEYRIHMIQDFGTDNFLLSAEDNAGNEVIDTVTITPELADGIQKIALTDHGLGGYEDDWKIPTGMDRRINWDLGSGDTSIVLSSGHIDEIAAWLRFATGEEEWDGGDEWEF